MTTPLSSEVWRDYQIDGIPSSGAYRPQKSQIRLWGAAIDALLAISSRTVTAAGDITILPDDVLIRDGRTTGGTRHVVLPAAAVRGDLEITVKDVAGNAASFAIALIPNGSEDIDGLDSGDGGYPISLNYGLVRLRPRTGGYDVMVAG